MSDQQDYFQGAQRAERYQEGTGSSVEAWQRVGQQPGAPAPSPPPQHAAPLPGFTLPQAAQEAPPAEPVQLTPVPPRIDLEAVSRDLSGGWFAEPTSRQDATPTRAQQGVRGMLARLGVPVAPGRAERETLEHRAKLTMCERIVRQATWTRPVCLLVAQRKGGVGKTPVAILLAGIMAHVRGGRVVALEVSDDPGMMALRGEGSPRRGLGELLEAVEQITSSGQLGGYTAPQTSHAALIGSPRGRRALTGQDVQKLHALLGRYYDVQVLDSGNVYSSGAFTAAVDVADGLVIPVTDAADSMQDALALVAELQRSEHGRRLIRHASVLRLRYVDGDPNVVERVDQAIAGMGVATVIDIPADPHIAEHGELSLSKLAPPTRDAFMQAAAAVVQSVSTLEDR